MKKFLVVAALLAMGNSPADAALLQFDFHGNNGGGYFQVDTTHLTIGPAGYQIPTGALLGGADYTHYYLPTPEQPHWIAKFPARPFSQRRELALVMAW